jgi:hypothetical protein
LAVAQKLFPDYAMNTGMMAAVAGASGDPGGDMKKRRTIQTSQVVQRNKRLSPDDCMSSLCELFGAAAYYAQRFEAALKDFLVVYSQLVNDTANADALQTRPTKKTMGHLLRRIRDVVIIRSDWLMASWTMPWSGATTSCTSSF